MGDWMEETSSQKSDSKPETSTSSKSKPKLSATAKNTKHKKVVDIFK